MDIYEMWGAGLGDIWASVNYLFGLGKNNYFVSRITTQGGGDKHDTSDLVLRVSKLLDAPGKIEIIDKPATHKLTDVMIWKCGYYNVKQKWTGQKSAQIAYQLTGAQSNADKQNMSKEQKEELLTELDYRGYKLVEVGKPKSIEEIVNVLCNSTLFIGIDSGVSHVAHSCYLPCFLFQTGLTEKHIRKCHKYKEYKLYNSVKQFIQDQIEPEWHRPRQ